MVSNIFLCKVTVVNNLLVYVIKLYFRQTFLTGERQVFSVKFEYLDLTYVIIILIIIFFKPFG